MTSRLSDGPRGDFNLGLLGAVALLQHHASHLAGVGHPILLLRVCVRFGKVDNVHAPKMINVGDCCPPILRREFQVVCMLA